LWRYTTIPVVTISPEVQNFNSHFEGTAATLRIYASESGYSFEGEQVTGSQVGGTTWWKEIACTVSSGVVTIPEVELFTTTDSFPPNLTFTAILYSQDGARQNTKLSNFFLDEDLLIANDDTVIESAVTVTAAGTGVAQGNYTYRGQSNLKSYYTLEGQTASTTLYAIVWTGSQWNLTSSSGAVYYYSTDAVEFPWQITTWVASTGIAPLPAASQAATLLATSWNAVFLTNNTPCWPCGLPYELVYAWLVAYINNITVPWASTTVGGKIFTSKTPLLSNHPIAVESSEPAWIGVDNSRYLTEWDGDLAQAIADIGSDECTLWCTEADEYTNTGSLITSGTLTVGKAYEFAEYTGAVVYLNNVDGGTGYAIASGVATTGGTGTLTVDITAVDGGVITGVEINNAGSGYEVGTVLAISGGGGDARLVVAEVYNGNFTNVGATFLGYPTNFANAKGTVFIATGTTPTSWGTTSLRPCLVVPNNIHLAFSGSGTIKAGNGGGIYITSLLDPGQRQIFTSSGFGKIFVAPGACTAHNLSWWAGNTPSADNTHEFKQLQQSLSVGQKGGIAVIPIGDWKTQQITWTNQVLVRGSAQADIDGGQRGTAIYPADETELYTGVFSAQQIFHSITFEDMLLTANESETVNAFRFIATQSTSENLTFNRVRFENVCTTGAAVANTIFQGENSFQEFVNVNFYNCTWTVRDDTIAIFWESTNSVALFSNPQIRLGINSTGFRSPYSGYITFLQPDFRGPADYTDLPITTDRTIATAFDTVSGDNTVNLNEDYATAGAQWTREDLGGFIAVAGVTWGVGNATKTYITQLNTAFQAEVADAPNSTVNNQNVTVSYPGDYPYLAYAALNIATHLEINIFGSSDEGINYLVVDTATDYEDTVSLFGSKVQGRILFDGGSSSWNCIASEFYSGCFNSTGHDPLVRMMGGQISTEIVPRDDEEYPFPNFRELLSAEVWHLCPNELDVVSDTSAKLGDRRLTTLNEFSVPVNVIRRDQFGSPSGDDPQLAILNSFLPGDPDQVGLQIGTSWRGSDLPLHYYDFYRQITAGTTTGALVIRGSQTAFAGIYHNGYILADGSIKSTDPVEAVGYATGAGATVTQITSKSTAVTINAVSGQITMHNATLNAGATVFFVVNNTSTRAYDTPIIGHASGGTPDSYEITWNTVSNLTSFRVGVKNITGGNLSEAIVLNFNLFRGVNS